METIGGSADDGSSHQVYEHNEGQPFQNLKVYRQQESRSLENNERSTEIILSDQPMAPSDQQNPSSTGCEFTNSRGLQNQKAQNKKAQQSTLEMQMTGKGQYRLVKVKNRSQDPHTRKQDHQHRQEDYDMAQ